MSIMIEQKIKRFSVYVTSLSCGFHMNCCSLLTLEDAKKILCHYGKMIGVQWVMDSKIKKDNKCCIAYLGSATSKCWPDYGYTASIYENIL
jgi:hypothetical protein